jgi:DNA-binding IclR family transcriptional regulator
MGVLDAGKVAILAQVNAPTSIGFYVKLGSTVDLLEAASGYVILAHLRGEERERTLAEWKHLTGKRVPADIERHLDRIRQIGYEQRASHQVKGVVDISFPICDERGSALGALTIPYIEYGTSPDMLKDVVMSLKMGAKQINSAIGGKTSESHITRR